MNLLEEYISVKGNIIIMLSGLSGSNKSVIAKIMSEDFGIELINLNDYIVNVTMVEFNGVEIEDWDNIEIYDWDKLNSDISLVKNYIICGDMFPEDKITFVPDFHIHITMTKAELYDKRVEMIEKDKEKYKKLLAIGDELKKYLNKITYGHYVKNKEKSKIDLWVTYSEKDEMYNKIFDYIIEKMKEYLTEHYAKEKREFDYIKKKDKTKFTFSSSSSENSGDHEEGVIVMGKFHDYIDELRHVL